MRYLLRVIGYVLTGRCGHGRRVFVRKRETHLRVSKRVQRRVQQVECVICGRTLHEQRVKA